MSIGNVGQLVVDLLISSLRAERIGYFDGSNFLPCVGNNAYVPSPPSDLSLPLEAFDSSSNQLTFVQQRSPVVKIIFSVADEYVPEYVDKKALVERAMGGAENVEIERGNHALSSRVQEAVQAIINFVKREGPKGWDDPWS